MKTSGKWSGKVAGLNIHLDISKGEAAYLAEGGYTGGGTCTDIDDVIRLIGNAIEHATAVLGPARVLPKYRGVIMDRMNDRKIVGSTQTHSTFEAAQRGAEMVCSRRYGKANDRYAIAVELKGENGWERC